MTAFAISASTSATVFGLGLMCSDASRRLSASRQLGSKRGISFPGAVVCSWFLAMVTAAGTTHACFPRLCFRLLLRSLARCTAHKRDAGKKIKCLQHLYLPSYPSSPADSNFAQIEIMPPDMRIPRTFPFLYPYLSLRLARAKGATKAYQHPADCKEPDRRLWHLCPGVQAEVPGPLRCFWREGPAFFPESLDLPFSWRICHEPGAQRCNLRTLPLPSLASPCHRIRDTIPRPPRRALLRVPCWASCPNPGEEMLSQPHVCRPQALRGEAPTQSFQLHQSESECTSCRPRLPGAPSAKASAAVGRPCPTSDEELRRGPCASMRGAGRKPK